MAKYPRKLLQKIYTRVVGAMSGMNGVQVILKEDACPHFNPDTLTITTFPVVGYARSDEEDFTVGRGIMVHEASHVMLAPSCDEVEKELKNLNYTDKEIQDWFTWMNVFLDANNEYKISEMYPHLKKVLADKTNIFFETNPKARLSDNPFIRVLDKVDMLAGNNLAPITKKDGYTKFVDKWSKKYMDNKHYESDGETLKKFTNDVFIDWMKLHKDSEKGTGMYKKEIHEMCKKMGKCIKDGDKKSAEELKEKIKGLTEKKNGSTLKNEHTSPKNVRVHTKFFDHDYSKKTLEELKEMLKKSEESKVRDGVLAGNAWGNSPVDLDANVEIFPVEDIAEKVRHQGNTSIDKVTAHREGKRINRALKAKIKLQESFETGHRSGRLNFDQIREQVSKFGRIVKENVFNRNNLFTRGGEWAIEVLIDCSGSMYGEKMKDAKQALATLAYALDGLPNVNYALTGFTEINVDYVRTTVEIPIKRFAERKLLFEKLDKLEAISGNCDGLNIRVAAKRLIKHGNKRKILIVISDGQPAYNNGLDDTKMAVEQIQKFGIDVLGIGIEGATEKALKYIYPNHYLFKQNENLANDLTNLILSSLGQKDKLKLIKNKWEL